MLVPQSRPGEGEARGGRRPLLLDSGSRSPSAEGSTGGEAARRLSLFFFFFIFRFRNREEGVCVVLLSSSERQSETRDMMETTTTATTTGREAEEGTSSRETLENHPGNAGSRATEDLQEGQQLQEGKGDEAFGRGSALGGPDGIVVDASNPVVAHTPAARSLGLGKDPVSKVLGGGVAKALKPTSTAAARSEKKRRNEIRRRWARATDAKSTSLSSSSTLTCRLSFFLSFFGSLDEKQDRRPANDAPRHREEQERHRGPG